MKRKDIKAGVVYAELISYGTPRPIVFLEDEAATVYLEPFSRNGNDPYLVRPSSEKPRRGKGWNERSQGYAAVRGAAELLEGLEPAAELEAFKSRRQPSRDGLRFELVTSLGAVQGLHHDAIAAHEAARASEKAARDRADAEAEAHDARLAAAVDGLEKCGIPARVVAGYKSDLIGLDIETAERLLSLLRDEEA